MNDPTIVTPVEAPGLKQRHGCLTAYLVFVIIMNSVVTLYYLLGSEVIRQSMPTLPSWIIPVMIVVGVVNLVCAIALLRWKKWGFWGLVGTAVVATFFNMSAGFGLASGVAALVSIAMLYGVLQIGKERKGWPQLD